MHTCIHEQHIEPSIVCSSASISAPFHAMSNFRPADFSPIASIYALNNTVGTHNIELSDTLEDLSIKSNILSTGILTPKEFANAQKLDPKIVALRDSYHPKMRYLYIHDDILYKIVKGKSLPHLPSSLEKLLFNCSHFHVLAGHRSSDTIISEINTQFFVPDLARKVKSFCNDCYICSISKSQRMLRSSQGITLQAKHPKHIMSFDIFGGLEKDADGYAYVYSFMDNFSLFVINIKAKTKTGTELLSAFLRVFAIWSQLPELVVSDNESGLMTKEAMDFFASFNIKHNPGASHASWRLLSEGASIRKSKEFMRSSLAANPRTNWTSALEFATIALNTTKTIHGYSPVQMFYGNRKPINAIVDLTTQCSSLETYIEVVTAHFNKLIEKVNASRAQSNEKRTALINKHRKSKVFKVNDLVWLKALAISPNQAMKMKNKGPFKILQAINEHSYKLSSLSNPQKCIRISRASHLEPYKNSVDLTAINFPMINIAPKHM
jgi:hypothetical protein